MIKLGMILDDKSWELRIFQWIKTWFKWLVIKFWVCWESVWLSICNSSFSSCRVLRSLLQMVWEKRLLGPRNHRRRWHQFLSRSSCLACSAFSVLSPFSCLVCWQRYAPSSVWTLLWHLCQYVHLHRNARHRISLLQLQLDFAKLVCCSPNRICYRRRRLVLCHLVRFSALASTPAFFQKSPNQWYHRQWQHLGPLCNKLYSMIYGLPDQPYPRSKAYELWIQHLAPEF